MENVIGQLSQEPGEVSGEWRIPNFLSLPEEVDKVYRSPAFFFLDSCWCLDIYPNGETSRKTEGWVGIYLIRLDCNSPVTLKSSITARLVNKDLGEYTFKVGTGWGLPTFLKRSDLQSGLLAVSPSDDLTISYTLKSVDKQLSENTLCHRLWRTSLQWNDTLGTQKNDVVLKLKDGNISVERAILELFSPVFARMFATDVRESHAGEVNTEEMLESHAGEANIEGTRVCPTGEVNIEDASRSVFRVALSYAYSGDPKGLSCENMCEVYKVAHKYEFQELRELCSKFMKNTLCADTVCDVIALGDLYQETELMESAKEYFAKNKIDILKAEKWKIFKRNNPDTAWLLLESMILAGDVQK